MAVFHLKLGLYFYKLALVVYFIFLSPDVFVSANDQNGFLVQCFHEDVSSWHQWWYWSSHATNGTKCNVQCPLNCTCSLGNVTDVIARCSNGSILKARISYPSNVTYLSWAHNNLYNISKESFVGLSGTLVYLHLSNNSLQHLQPGTFESLVNLVHLHLRNNSLKEVKPGVLQQVNNLRCLDFGFNKLKVIQPNIFYGLKNLSELYLDNNMLKEIQLGVFEGLGNLLYLELSNNMLDEVQPGIFNGLQSLSNLDLHNSMLGEIQPGVFNDLRNLTYLFLNNNMLKEIQPHVFDNLENLKWLFLQDNVLEEIHPGGFRGLRCLEWLYLENNMLSILQPTVLGNLRNLLVLYLSNNPLSHLHSSAFQNLSNLDVLMLHNISLMILPENIFKSLHQLRHLDLSENNLNQIGPHHFQTCVFLKALNLTKNPLQWINKDSFSDLNLTTRVVVDNPASCCFVTTAMCHHTSPKSPFLTCGRLLPFHILRIGIWIVSIFAIVNNVVGIMVKYKQRNQINKVQFLLITNLSISDLLMGVYLIILLSVDLYYTDFFPSHSESWRNSNLCKIAGSLSVLSSEASVFFITLISIDRFLRVKFPYSRNQLNYKSVRVVLTLLWLLALTISITSFVLSGKDDGVYALSEICVGLPISRQYDHTSSKTDVHLSNIYTAYTERVVKYDISGGHAAMYFSISIFTVLNLGCFFVVGCCYSAIFILVWKSAKKLGLSISRNEIRMAKKVFLLVLTDFCCWVPLGVLSILVQAGAVEVNPVAYAWIATFILPINSSINPFLYTLGDVIADKVACSCNLIRKNTQDTCELY